eukprot:CAMPEP_0178639958 /NCGR_PEP_ID=MMETSP0698-20121128/15755_1 /TAXON_ID=265572 /ORGANISM="Extubocellulus spinifer, Strain CCMP396" /LENGTH=261 /DNA_ID=CAMNT_0020280355 /DNA_START=346 /DNA_END=1128 /DNA_ORIENTATION=+
MSGGQEEKIPLYLRAKDDDPMGLDILCSWLSHNNHNEYCDYLTEMSMDQAALLLSCCKLLRLIVKEGRAEVKPLVQAHIMANTLYTALKDFLRTRPGAYSRSEMNKRARAITQKVQEEVDAYMKKQEADRSRNDDTEEQDEIAKLKAQLKRQEEDAAARLKKQEEDAAARIKKREEDYAIQLKERSTRDDHQDDADEQDTVAALKAQLKKLEEDYAARLKKQEEDAAARIKKTQDEADVQLKMHTAGGQEDDAEDEDTVAA